MSQAAHHDSQMARLRDAEEAFERAYIDWMHLARPRIGLARDDDWALIAYEMGVTDCYKRIK